MNYTDLINCLLDELRRRVRNGETTERGLSQLAGLSQPHLHHVLKGKRRLSVTKADAILLRLKLDVRDLIPPKELQESDFRR